MTYQKVVSEQLGEGYECQPNTTESMLLCSVRMESPNRAGLGVKFLVFDQEQHAIIYTDNIDNGAVSWQGASELALFYTPGIMRTGQTRDDYTYVYDLKTGERTKKSKMK